MKSSPIQKNFKFETYKQNPFYIFHGLFTACKAITYTAENANYYDIKAGVEK